MIYPHGDIESLGADIFAVRGSIRINLLMRISRNMGIVRDGSELTLVNPIQLRPETERELAQLGEVYKWDLQPDLTIIDHGQKHVHILEMGSQTVQE